MRNSKAQIPNPKRIPTLKSQPLHHWSSYFYSCAVWVLTGACIVTCGFGGPSIDARGNQFIGFKHFGVFEKTRGERVTDLVLTSREIKARIKADQVVASWNATLPQGTWLEVEVRGIHLEGATKFYKMGIWSENPDQHPRESVLTQKDQNGNVLTDTLVLKEPCDRFKMRVTLHAKTRLEPKLTFLGLCLTDSNAVPAELSMY